MHNCEAPGRCPPAWLRCKLQHRCSLLQKQRSPMMPGAHGAGLEEGAGAHGAGREKQKKGAVPLTGAAKRERKAEDAIKEQTKRLADMGRPFVCLFFVWMWVYAGVWAACLPPSLPACLLLARSSVVHEPKSVLQFVLRGADYEVD